MASKQPSQRQYFPLDWTKHFIDGELGEQKLTDGEKEGIETDLAS